MCSSSRLAATAVACVVALVASPVPASAQAPVDHTDVKLGSAYNISTEVSAADFVVSGATTLVTGAKIWLNDVDYQDDGTLNHFTGNLSWAIYDDGAAVPGTLIRSGDGVNIVQVDTGIQEVFGDAIQVRFDLDRPLALEPGTYWLALHENGWGSDFDLTSVYWQIAATLSGTGLSQSSSLDPPGGWSTGSPSDLAFALYGGPMVWNQEHSTVNAIGISSYVSASDFTLVSEETFSALEIWIWTQNDSDFSGTLSWAIYDDDSGQPGTTLLGTGVDTATRVVATGEGGDPYEIRELRASMGRSMTLPAGTYWLALHEGEWGSANDGSEAYWGLASSLVGNGSVSRIDPPSPGPWVSNGSMDLAFILYNEQLFASGFDTATTCAWSNLGGICP